MTTLTTRLDALEFQGIINGGFDLWQRGNGPTTPGTSYAYLADRFASSQSGYTMTQQRSTDVPTQALSGYQSNYSLLMTNGTGASPTSGQWQVISYKMEGQDYARFHARKNRLQFLVKTSVAGTYVISLRNAGVTRGFVTTYSINSANTWTKVFIDFSADSTGTWAFDNTTGLEINWTLTSGSSFQTSTLNTWQTTSGTTWGTTTQTQWGATTGATFQIAQVMLIPQDFTQAGASNVDIPFQRAGRTIGAELALCQRFLYIPDWEQSNSNTIVAQGQCYTSSTGVFFVPFPVNMRAAPGFTQSGTFTANTAAGGNAGNPTLTVSTLSAQMAVLGASGMSGLVAGNSTYLQKTSLSSQLIFSAEL